MFLLGKMQQARSEAVTAFGNGGVYLEKINFMLFSFNHTGFMVSLALADKVCKPVDRSKARLF